MGRASRPPTLHLFSGWLRQAPSHSARPGPLNPFMDSASLLILLLIGLILAWAAALAYTCWVLSCPPRRTFAYALTRNIPSDPSGVLLASDRDPITALASHNREVQPPAHAIDFASWTFKSRGRDLPVWDVPGLNPNGPTVIVSHGWSDSRVVALRTLPALLPHSRRIVLWDMPGHGEAPGVCSLGTREVEDLLVLVQTVREGGAHNQEETGDPPIILYGSSLGAGVSIAAAAADTHVRAVVAEAPYRFPIVPARNVMRFMALPGGGRAILPVVMGILGLRWGHGLSWCRAPWSKRFDRASLAALLHCPLLVIHGENDPVCPSAGGQQIAEAAREAKMVLVPGAAHNNLWTEPIFVEQCTAALRDFLRKNQSASLPTYNPR